MLSLAVAARTAESIRRSPTITPEGSHFFIGAPSFLYPNDVCAVLGNFLPENPHIFFVAHAQIRTPWLFVQAFRLCVSLGPLLHHEGDFSFFRGRTIVCEGDTWSSPCLTIMIPHDPDFPFWLIPTALPEAGQYSDRVSLRDLGIPRVGLVPYQNCIWRRDLVSPAFSFKVQAAMMDRLEQSWAESRLMVAE